MECQITKYCKMVEPMLDKGRDIALLGLRLVLAYTFYAPAMMKWSDISSTAMWFESMGIPLPTLNAYMAASTELAGAVLLTLGFATRFISIPLIVLLFVAIATVHGVNGFNVMDDTKTWTDAYVNGEMVKGTLVYLQNGYELVLYYILMLFTLLTTGAGKLSVDHFIGSRKS